MRGFLLDTDAVLRLGFEPDAADAQLAERLSESPRHISLISAVEMAIKLSIGKLRLPPSFHVSFEHGFGETVRQLQAATLSLQLRHIEVLSRLPLIHRDPFDRLLISQAIAEHLTIVSGDRKFAGYPGLDVLEI